MEPRLSRAARTAWSAAAAALVAATAAGETLGFSAADAGALPDGWRAAGDGAVIGVDDEVSFAGGRSLRIVSGGGGRRARAVRRIEPPDVAGNRIRISVRIRTEAVDGAAGLWLRIDGDGGMLYVDGRGGDGVSGTTDWTMQSIEAPVLEQAASLEIGLMLRGSGTAWFDTPSVEGVDTAARPPPAPAAARYVEHALTLIDAHAIGRSAVDWPAYRDAVLGQARGARTPSETYVALRYAVAALDDHHSYLMTPERAAALAEAPVSNARTGRPPVRPDGRMLGGDSAYVSVPGFAGGSHDAQVEFAERLQAEIARLDARQRCGWIVDLRGNSGGNLWPMLVGLGPLLGDGEAAGAIYADGRRASIWYRGGRAGLGRYARLRVRGDAIRLREDEPRIAVLLGGRTASSGEIVALALAAGAGERRSFGAPTRGLATGTRTFTLPDGAALVLAVAATTDREGRVQDGPLEPDVRVGAGRDGAPASQEAVRAALGWLREACEAPAPARD